ncbi:hypothetical protein HanIR_Chr01g0035841 [Helianthus annuus]|nr:hypothetical protein HanIR_Chr01g0035841 [Helianthus annuus]
MHGRILKPCRSKRLSRSVWGPERMVMLVVVQRGRHLDGGVGVSVGWWCWRQWDGGGGGDKDRERDL